MLFSSPTTTSAVNENRRPPLTTLATRLISTTRSCRSRLEDETDRSGAGMAPSRVAVLDGQAALAGAVREGRDAAVVLVAAAVEHGGLDAGGLRTLGQQLAGLRGLLHRLERAQVGLGPVDRGDRATGVVVDELGEDAAVGAVDADARALGRAAHLGADAAAALEAPGGGVDSRHARLPTFRATYSPW